MQPTQPTPPTQRVPAPAEHPSCLFVMSEGYMEKLDSAADEGTVVLLWGVFWPSWCPGPADPTGLCGAEQLQGRAMHQAVVLGVCWRHLGGLAKYELKVFDCSINWRLMWVPKQPWQGSSGARLL